MKSAEYLSRCIGERIGGSDAEYQAVQYVAAALERLGLRTRIDQFDFVGWEQSSATVQVVSPDRWTMPCLAMPYTTSLPGGETGDLVRNGVMHIVPGRIEWPRYDVVVRERVEAVVIANPSGPPLPVPNTRPLLCRPTFIIGSQDRSRLESLLERGMRVSVRVQSRCRFVENMRSWNVAAMPDQPDSKVVIVSAHLDSAAGSPGAVDNASGIEGMLEVAERLLDSGRRRRSGVGFVAFGSEEWYLLGSTHFLYELLDSGQRDSLRALLNLDMIGSGDRFVVRAGQEGFRDSLSDYLQRSKTGSLLNDAFIETPKATTDYWPFFQGGLDGLDILSLPCTHYHQPADVFEDIEPNRVSSVVDFVCNIVEWLEAEGGEV